MFFASTRSSTAPLSINPGGETGYSRMLKATPTYTAAQRERTANYLLYCCCIYPATQYIITAAAAAAVYV